MPYLTLAEAQQRATDTLESAIYETIISDGDILGYLPLLTHNGDAYTFLRESALPTVAWRSPTGVWTHDESSTTIVTVRLKIVGGDIDVSNYFQETLSDTMDMYLVELKAKLKALTRDVNDMMVYGDEDNNALQPDGFHDFLQNNTGQRRERGSGGAAQVARIQDLDWLLRTVKGGDPSVILMDKPTRDSLKRYWDGLGSSYATMDAFGKKLMAYNGIPILGTDWISSTEAVSGTSFDTKTGGSATSIFAARFAPDGMHGLVANGHNVPQIRLIGELETASAKRTRIEWFINPVVIKTPLAVAGITGCTSGGTWTA